MIKFEHFSDDGHIEIECKGDIPTLTTDAIFIMSHVLSQYPEEIRMEFTEMTLERVLMLVASGAYEKTPKTKVDLNSLKRGTEGGT